MSAQLPVATLPAASDCHKQTEISDPLPQPQGWLGQVIRFFFLITFIYLYGFYLFIYLCMLVYACHV